MEMVKSNVEVGSYLVVDREDTANFYEVTNEGPKKIAVWTTGVLWKESKEFIPPTEDEFQPLNKFPKLEEIFKGFMESGEDHITLGGDMENPVVEEE